MLISQAVSQSGDNWFIFNKVTKHRWTRGSQTIVSQRHKEENNNCNYNVKVYCHYYPTRYHLLSVVCGETVSVVSCLMH